MVEWLVGVDFSFGDWSRVRGMVMVRATLLGELEHFVEWRQFQARDKSRDKSPWEPISP